MICLYSALFAYICFYISLRFFRIFHSARYEGALYSSPEGPTSSLSVPVASSKNDRYRGDPAVPGSMPASKERSEAGNLWTSRPADYFVSSQLPMGHFRKSHAIILNGKQNENPKCGNWITSIEATGRLHVFGGSKSSPHRIEQRESRLVHRKLLPVWRRSALLLRHPGMELTRMRCVISWLWYFFCVSASLDFYI